MTVLLFPGQGSQFQGMGKNLFSLYKQEVKDASSILGVSIEEICLDQNQNYLLKTKYAQPAIYFVNALNYISAKIEKPISYALGHSLGEYNALQASGAFDLLTGLEIVKKRGELMGECPPGKMIAVLKVSLEELQSLLATFSDEGLFIANYNTPTQFVVAGEITKVEAFEKYLSEMEVNFIPLKTSGAFHTPLMSAAADTFKNFLARYKFQSLKFPVISNRTAKPYPGINYPDELSLQMIRPVLWMKSIHSLLDEKNLDYWEAGEAQMLSRMTAQIKKDVSRPIQNKSRTSEVVSRKKINLGNPRFREILGANSNLVSGSMYRAIASVDMVSRLSNARFLSFFGSGGLTQQEICSAVDQINGNTNYSGFFGVNVLFNPNDESALFSLVMQLINKNVKMIEASAFVNVSPALVYYTVKGLNKRHKQQVVSEHKLFLKTSSPELALQYLSPPPESTLNQLLNEGLITQEEKAEAKCHPIATFITLELDSGGHTDYGSMLSHLPLFMRTKKLVENKYPQFPTLFLGLAGGIGTPEAIAYAFTCGVDYVQIGSVNQCSVESGTSSIVKTLLSKMNINDTAYAPAGDMFEVGAKVQVLKKGVLFPNRANKLYSLYSLVNSIDEIPHSFRVQLEKFYYRMSLDQVLEEMYEYYISKGETSIVEYAKKNKKYQMSLICRWYFGSSTDWTLQGDESRVQDFQIHTGPAMGAFNQFLKGTELEAWDKRHVDLISQVLIEEALNLSKNKASIPLFSSSN